MARLELNFFGSPRIMLDGATISIPERKPVALFAYLVVTDEMHARDHLATLFWPEYDQRRARANLRYALWMLKKSLGEVWLQGRAPSERGSSTVGFTPGPGTDMFVDVLRFQTLIAQAQHGEPDAPDPHHLYVTHLQEAAALYREDFLAGFTLSDSTGFDEWQFLQAERLRLQLAVVLDHLTRHHAHRHALEAALDYARRRLALDPLHEPAHRQLMRLYAENGQQAAALRQYAECVRLLETELDIAPETVTAQLYAKILARRIAPPAGGATMSSPSGSLHNLPAHPTRFVGRKAELKRLGGLLAEPDCRLLTLVGPGGIGKTRLAIEAAAAQAHALPHGTRFVPLSTLEDPDQLASAILAALDASILGATDPRPALFNYLQDKELLLLLDNFEHLVEGADFLVELLTQAPGITCLVTSRERLNLREEWLFPVAGMEDDGVQLFLQCARRLRADMPAEAVDLALVRKICDLVAGMPLAIELAAAWLYMLSLHAIAEEIDRRLGFLSTAWRNMPARHRSMHAVFDHSWALLTTDEKSILCRLAVFRGGFTCDAGQTVADASLALLAALVDKSWLHKTADDRYDLHPLIRQYIAEKLATEYTHLTGAQAEDVRDRHAATYLALLSQREEALSGPEQRGTFLELLAEIDNIWAAWHWAVARRRVDWLAPSMYSLWALVHGGGLYHTGVQAFADAVTHMKTTLASLENAGDSRPIHEIQPLKSFLASLLCWQGWLSTDLGQLARAESLCLEGLELLEDLAPDARDPKAYAHALLAVGWALYHQGKYVQAEPRYRQALAHFDAVDDARWCALTQTFLGLNAIRQGQVDQAEEYIRTSLASWQARGDLAQTSTCLRIMSQIACARGDYAWARTLLDDAFQAAQGSGVLKQVCHTHLSLGDVAQATGKYGAARSNYETGLQIACESGDRLGEVAFRNGLAGVSLACGEYAEAGRLFQESLAVCLEMGRRRDAGRAHIGLGDVSAAQNDHAEAEQHYAKAHALLTPL